MSKRFTYSMCQESIAFYNVIKRLGHRKAHSNGEPSWGCYYMIQKTRVRRYNLSSSIQIKRSCQNHKRLDINVTTHSQEMSPEMNIQRKKCYWKSKKKLTRWLVSWNVWWFRFWFWSNMYCVEMQSNACAFSPIIKNQTISYLRQVDIILNQLSCWQLQAPI